MESHVQQCRTTRRLSDKKENHNKQWRQFERVLVNGQQLDAMKHTSCTSPNHFLAPEMAAAEKSIPSTSPNAEERISGRISSSVREGLPFDSKNDNPRSDKLPSSDKPHLHHNAHNHCRTPLRPRRHLYQLYHRHQARRQANLSNNLISSDRRQMISRQKRLGGNRSMITSEVVQKTLAILVMSAVLSQLLSHHLIHLETSPTTDDKQQNRLHLTRIFPRIVSASATTAPETSNECRRDGDCAEDMRCYQGKCICPKDRPIEDRGVCLPSSVVGEACSIAEQCLGNSACIEGFCACGSDAISLFNPSSKIYYCHPKRRLREECGHDAQCPSNSFCSTNKCLCQNGYGPVLVAKTAGDESDQCLPKICSVTRDCESEYHICEDNRCICLADHFDPHTAECYKFGSTGGKLSANQTTNGPGGNSIIKENNNGFTRILKDLMENSDKFWYVILVLIVAFVLVLALIVMTLRRYFLGYCWTAHKKEYEPNNEGAPRSGYFNKDSINNKSFRQKNTEADDDGGDDNDDTAAADRSNLMTATTVNKTSHHPLTNGKQKKRSADNGKTATAAADTENRYVKVDMQAVSSLDEQAESTDAHYQPYHQQLLSRPLSTSKSTAV